MVRRAMMARQLHTFLSTQHTGGLARRYRIEYLCDGDHGVEVGAECLGRNAEVAEGRAEVQDKCRVVVGVSAAVHEKTMAPSDAGDSHESLEPVHHCHGACAELFCVPEAAADVFERSYCLSWWRVSPPTRIWQPIQPRPGVLLPPAFDIPMPSRVPSRPPVPVDAAQRALLPLGAGRILCGLSSRCLPYR